MKKKHNLSFDILTDENNRLASQFGLVFKLPEYLRELYLKFGIDLVRYNGDDSWSLPMPGRFIVNRKGIIQSENVDPDYTVRPEPVNILDELKGL